MNLLVYGLCEERLSSSLDHLNGVGGRDLKSVSHHGIIALVTEAEPGHRLVTPENILAYDSALRQVLAVTTPLPFRFGTIVTQPRLQEYIDSHIDTVREALELVRGAVEMGVKILWNPSPAEDFPDQVQEASTDSLGPGTAFLRAKQAEHDRQQSLKLRADGISTWLEEALRPAIRRAFVQVNAERSLVLAAAHLVERSRIEDYRELIRRARAARPELRFLTSGPWAPYSFSSRTGQL